MNLDAETLDRMQGYLDHVADKLEDYPLVWPEDVLAKSSELFVSDFPLGRPGLTVEEYDLNPSLTFSQIENLKDDYHRARAIFKNSKAYKWFYATVLENNTGRDFGFGYMSNSLHERLSDDPAPYRREIKDLLANLYLYIKFYASDEIEIYVPGGRSEVIRLVS